MVGWCELVILFMSSGPYWIDPNGGCEKDAVEVWCDYSKQLCRSCVDPVKKVRRHVTS